MTCKAVRAVLELHVMQEKPVRSYTHCAAHAFNPETRKFGSFEAVRDCPDCTYTEYYVCSHCECPNDEWPCPTYSAITREIAGTPTSG